MKTTPLSFVDAQWIPSDLGEPLPEVRWLDRMVFEDKLIITWRGLVTSYMQKPEKPFRIDPRTLLRNDAPRRYGVKPSSVINRLSIITNQDTTPYSAHDSMS
jgi:ATP-dependent DNA helicase RecG